MRYADGAFKEVEVYDTFVIKRAKGSELIDYADAQYQETFYDSDGVFHYSWVDARNDDIESGSEDSNIELSNEYHFMRRYANRFPIFVPIIEGSEFEYSMRRADVYEDVVERGRDEDSKEKLRKHILKKAKTVAASRGRRVNVRKCEVDTILDIALAKKMPIHRIIDNLVMFLMFDDSHNLLCDMHSGNVGWYRGRVATFDVGRANTHNRLSSKRKQSTIPPRKLRQRLKNEDNEIYVKLLALKYERRKIKFKNKAPSRIVEIDTWGYLSFRLENGYWFSVRSIEELNELVV